MTKKNQRNMQRIPLTLFIPWDADGRIYLDEQTFITKDTEVKADDGKFRKFREGIVIQRKTK